jgi:hypothetical protein
MRRILVLFLLHTPFSFLLAQDDAFLKQRYFVEDMRIVTKGEKYGFVNRQYIQVIPFIYLDAKDFSEGLAAVRMNDSAGHAIWVFIDKIGKQAISGKYEAVEHSFKHGLAAIKNEGKVYIIDKDGRQVVQADEQWQLPFRHGLVEVKSNNMKYGVANLRGKLVAPIAFEDVQILSPNVVVVGKNNNYGLLDSNGRVIVEPKYDYMGYFNEGMLAVKKGDKWGFINEEGKEVVPIQFDEMGVFGEGIAWVSLNKEGFYIDKRGERITNSKASQISTPQHITKKSPDLEFLDQLNELATTFPYIDQMGFETLLEKPFVIQNGLLVGVFRKYTTKGPVLTKIAVPIGKLQYVWHDYHLGFEFDEKVATVQSSLPGERVFDKGEKTNMLYLATPGDGHDDSLTEKLKMAIKALQNVNRKGP